MNPTQAKLDQMYKLLCSDPKPSPVVCKCCKKEVVIAMAYIPPTGVTRRHRRHLEAVNRGIRKKIESGNVICTDCALA